MGRAVRREDQIARTERLPIAVAWKRLHGQPSRTRHRTGQTHSGRVVVRWTWKSCRLSQSRGRTSETRARTPVYFSRRWLTRCALERRKERPPRGRAPARPRPRKDPHPLVQRLDEVVVEPGTSLRQDLLPPVFGVATDQRHRSQPASVASSAADGGRASAWMAVSRRTNGRTRRRDVCGTSDGS